jgi:hypothetical protein
MQKLVLLVFCGFIVFFYGCGEESQPVAENQSQPKEVKVIVPEAVAGKWKSVKILLQDLERGTESTYQVDIGGSFQIPDSSLRVTVENFMPAFAVNSERATSASNTPTNPAAQIVVHDGDVEIHRGWVFGLYPERHRFETPRYKFVLLDYKSQG